MELRCGYVNGDLSNCIYVPHCFDPTSDGGGGGWGGDGGGGGSTPTQPTQTNTIDKSKLQPCQAQVLQHLQASSGTALLGIVKLLSSAEPGYNWTVKDGTLSDKDTYGLTSSLYDTSTRSVTTTFDASKWGNASDLNIARTMLHEAVHAYLVAYFANSNYAFSPNATFGDMMTAFQAIARTGQYPDLNVLHHNEMARGGTGNGWIGDIAWSLQQYGIQQGYSIDKEFYMDMAWGGLTDTPAFLALSTADQNRILNTILIELTGRDKDGKTAQQKGVSSGC